MLEKSGLEIIASLNPLNYSAIANKKISYAVSLVIKVLLISCLIAGLLFWPKFTVLNYKIQQELDKIENINVKGSVDLSENIMVPEEDPWLYITDDEKATNNESKIFIGPDKIKYFAFKEEYEFDMNATWEEKKEKLKPVVTYLLSLLLSGLVAIIFLVLLAKYLAISLIIGLMGYLLLDLTPFRVGMKKSINTAFYAMIWLIPLEIITWPLGNNWLLPFKEIFYVKFYLLSLLLYLLLYLVGIVFIVLSQGEKTNLDIEWKE